MKALIAYLLRFHRDALLNAVIADYFDTIPQRVTDDAVAILKEKRPRIDKWIAFQSLALQRRMVNDPKNPQITFGMLLQLKIISHMISGTAPLQEESEGLKPASAAQEARQAEEALAKAQEGVAAFVKRGK